MTADVRIVATREEYAERFNALIDKIARERRYIGFVEGPSVDSARAFVRRILDGGGIQLLAVTRDDRVVGWCDIIRNPIEGFRHVGRLGMGLLPGYRGRGLGRQLATKAIQAAHERRGSSARRESWTAITRTTSVWRWSSSCSQAFRNT